MTTVKIDGVEWEYQPDMATWTNDKGECRTSQQIRETEKPWRIEDRDSLAITCGDSRIDGDYRIIAVQYDKGYPGIESDFRLMSMSPKIAQSLRQAVEHFENIGLGDLPMVCEWRADLMEAGV